jgi:hypothetical protein
MTAMDNLRQQLIALLTVEQAHMSFENAVAGFPLAHINTQPSNVPYTFWHLLEHLRICQRDILDFCVLPPQDYLWLKFPDDLWPKPEAKADAAIWEMTIQSFLADRAALVALVQNPATDLCALLPHGEPYTVLREILVVADHNAYHVGELAILRQTLGLWAAGRSL